MLLRRREGERTGRALAASLVLHAAALGVMAAASGPPRPPQERVIAVDIVSPPPSVAGEKMAEPPATQEPAPDAPAQPEPQPPAPEPPAPEPTPPAPRPEPAKEPEKAPQPRREPERPAQRPPTPPASRPPAQTPPRPQAQPTRREPEKNAQGTQAERTQGQGTRTGPATGTTPRPDAAGGEGIRVRTDGDPCPVQGYCENVTRQVNRFFRPPAESAGATGEVCFRIMRDGSVTDIEARRVRGGGTAFRFALMEAAEAAGTRRAFGALPSAFDPARWRWCVELSPS